MLGKKKGVLRACGYKRRIGGVLLIFKHGRIIAAVRTELHGEKRGAKKLNAELPSCEKERAWW